MTSAADTPEGHNIDARYRIVKRIADGGMATVYQAVDERLDRTVAIKIMHSQLAQGPHHAQFVERFHREARSAAAIANPHIVQVYDTGEYEGLEYLVMEYVHGVNLRHEMNQVHTFNVRETLRIIDQTLDGLASAHRAGVIHRDIKPENILLNDRGHVQITDFGLAKATSQSTLSSTGMLLGTAAYLPPEMIEDGLATPQGDLYSVGIMAWEMLAGEVPFISANPITLVFKHVHEDVPSVLVPCPGIDPQVAQFIATLTARSLQQRPRDAGVAYEQLHVIMTRLSLDAWQYRHVPVAAGPPSLQQVQHSHGEDDGENGRTARDGNDNEEGRDRTRFHRLNRLAGVDAQPPTQPPAPPSASSNSSGEQDPTIALDTQDAQISPTASFGSFLAERLGTPEESQHSTEPLQDLPRTVTNRDRDVPSATATESITTVETHHGPGGSTSPSSHPDSTAPTKARSTAPFRSPSNRRRWLMAITALIALIATGAVAGWWYMLGPGSYWSMPRPGDITCPVSGVCRITKVSFSNYASILRSEGIPYQVSRAYSDTVSSGSIIATKPANVSDRLSKRHGDKVQITVSRGILRATIPQDIGDPTSVDGKDPLAALKRVGFTAVVHDASKDEYSQTLPEYALQSIDPKPGTTLNHNARITVVLSKGPMPVSMPDVIGRSQNDAQAAFDDAKLKVTYTQEFSDSVNQGAIISTSVSKGTQLHWGDHVDAVVSKGPETADVPNVVFSHPDEARKELEALGFTVRVNGTAILNLIRQQSAVGTTRLRDKDGKPTVITLELV